MGRRRQRNNQLFARVNGRVSREFLSSLPVELTYHEDLMGHEVSQESLDDVATWLTEQLAAR